MPGRDGRVDGLRVPAIRPLSQRKLAVAGTVLALIAAPAAAQARGATPAAHAGRLSTPSAARSATARSSSKAAPKSMYWGAWIGSQLTGTEAPWDMSAVTAFEREAGKGVSLISFSSPWENCQSSPCSLYGFDTAAMDNIRNHGAIPFFSWGSDALPTSVNEPDLSLSSIIAGTWDSYIRSWATSARTWGHPFFLRFDWEMNGNWFPWSVGVNGNTAAQYVAAWQHVHDIFTSVGATNVTWVWCPNIDPSNRWASLPSTYPGDAYVDWVGLDGYNWDSPWMSFDQLFRSTYDQLVTTVAPRKPVVIGETASTEHGGSKAAWITDLLATQLPDAYPQVKAFLWFDKVDSGMNWPLESSLSATAAFAAGIGSDSYVANRFGSLAGGTIRPLS
jgi:mannan endo-1,4-beta-mannosidase